MAKLEKQRERDRETETHKDGALIDGEGKILMGAISSIHTV